MTLLTKQERAKLREQCNRQIASNDVWTAACQNVALPASELIALLDHIDALEGRMQIIRELAAPIYSDKKVYDLEILLKGPYCAVAKLHEFGKRAKAAIASAPEGNKNG